MVHKKEYKILPKMVLKLFMVTIMTKKTSMNRAKMTTMTTMKMKSLDDDDEEDDDDDDD